MTSKGHVNISVTTIPSPRGGKEEVATGGNNGGGGGSGGSMNSPRGQLCLCSPTTHQGSFRCKFHRQASTTVGWFSRSKSMPPTRNNNTNHASSISPKSVESA
ncbi:hypothetical protein Ccrd_009977 [Cynara cardunculus var. scolymus]|uniref:Uncharacterized protein n=1 Tax=Cynara cardunculus var. scolymus TaxID=59895 RepID=A0A118K726_CYNCS|nr:hypothetical protein Ccrd_009977 [Cynara cardunculus var. scolymus]